MKCVLCERRIEREIDGLVCAEPQCSAMICPSCIARGRDRCPQHRLPIESPTPTDRPVSGVLQENACRPADADLGEMRARELGFIARFRARVESGSHLLHPKKDKPLRVKDWDRIRESGDEAASVRRLWPEAGTFADIRARLPVNPRCTYTFAKVGLTLEARCCADLDRVLAAGASASPRSFESLLEMIHAFGGRAARDGRHLVAGLLSPTGWSKQCIDRLTGAEGSPLLQTGVSVCLVGPGIRDVVAGSTDRMLSRYLTVFAGETSEEAVTRCKPGVYHALLASDRLFLAQYARDQQEDIETILEAATRLVDEHREMALVEVDGAGSTLIWRR